MSTSRASFGTSAPRSETPVSNEGREQDCGAIWVKQSDKDGSKYLSVKVELTPADLEEIRKTGVNAKGKYEISLIAFASKSYEEGSLKPKYRVLKSRKWIRT